MQRLQSRWTVLLLAAIAVISMTLGNGASSAPVEKSKLDKVSSSAEPQYDDKGNLKRPTDFRTWVFVGANIGLQYRKEGPETTQREQDRHKAAALGDFHNIYIRPESYEHYLKTGEFPDKTVLVMDVYEAKERDQQNIVSKGLFPGEQRSIEVAVRDSKRPDGSKTDWAYYVFKPPTKSAAKAFPDNACFDCHHKHANVDNVWVQFYPVLRDRPSSK